MFRVIVVALVMLAAASSASAQDQDHASFAPDVLKGLIFDPTTYAPAVVTWEATRLDWRSSQIFFRNGSFEHIRILPSVAVATIPRLAMPRETARSSWTLLRTCGSR